MSSDCPHCGHSWSLHAARCECGCLWTNPLEPAPAPSPTACDLLIIAVRDAIYTELGRQHEADEIQGAGYWDDDWGCLDGEPNWLKVAEAAIDATKTPGECQETAGDTEEKP